MNFPSKSESLISLIIRDFVRDDKWTAKLLGMIAKGKTVIDKMKGELAAILHKVDSFM